MSIRDFYVPIQSYTPSYPVSYSVFYTSNLYLSKTWMLLLVGLSRFAHIRDWLSFWRHKKWTETKPITRLLWECNMPYPRTLSCSFFANNAIGKNFNLFLLYYSSTTSRSVIYTCINSSSGVGTFEITE